MKPAKIIKIAWQGLARNKLRSLLTMLGVIIGVSAVIIMIAVSSGTEATIEEQITELRRTYAELAHRIRNPTHTILLNTPLLSQVWEDVAPLLDERLRAEPHHRIAGVPWKEMRGEVPLLLAELLQGARRLEEVFAELGDGSAPAELGTADGDREEKP